ncbi:MAG: GNAT family N-acetyltransferase [Flavobacterium sp.]|nr:MAG: GNAT family N-acetyltransferase [Flavobacterium sp.]
MKSAKRSDKQRAVELLCRSFKDNLSVNFMVGSGPGQSFRTRKLMEYAFETCYRFGEVLIKEDRSAVVLLTYPHLKPFSFYSVWLDVMLMFQVIGFSRLSKVLRREKLIKIQHPGRPFCYLWFIGVDPASQGQGIGTSLIAGVLAKMDAQNLPVYLETSVERNLSFYEKFGFQVFNQTNLGYLLFFLKRKY